MKLDEYLKKEDISQAKFARKLRMARTHFREVFIGKMRPSLRLALKIEDLTEGKVTCRDLLSSYEEKNKKDHAEDHQDS